MNELSPPRRIWLCADDYGISPGVNRAILMLMGRNRLNATSVMVVGPAIGREDVTALAALRASGAGAIGLHVTLTAPFQPLTMHYRPLSDGAFLPLGTMLRKSLLRQLDGEIIATEIAAQLGAFARLFGHPPDFVDGHQHVHLFPVVRDAFVHEVKRAAPQAWVRQCGRARPLRQRLFTPKAMILDTLSAGFRRAAAAAGLATNPGFAGAYDFTGAPDFAGLMPGFLDGLPDGGVVMCHPGFADATLRALDPFTEQRDAEFAYLAGGGFARLLTEANVALREPGILPQPQH
jgi:predicted glycoside hydrolase/deacetylase ChbG (UPF0249 family)